jgi:hypothetical protein
MEDNAELLLLLTVLLPLLLFVVEFARPAAPFPGTRPLAASVSAFASSAT